MDVIRSVRVVLLLSRPRFLESYRTRRGPDLHVGTVVGVVACFVALSGCSTPESGEGSADGPTASVPDGGAAGDDLARELRISDPPSVEVVREIAPDEYDAVLGECMEGAGFPAKSGDDSGLAFDFPDDQAEQASLALYVCQREYPVAERFEAGLSEEGARVMYQHLVESYVPCVSAKGYDVAEPPSLEKYLGTPERDRWTPWMEVHAQIRAQPDSGGLIGQLENECPPAPPLEELFPGD